VKGGTSGPDKYKGINAASPAVWAKYNGAGIGFVDLETGWNLDHDDLPGCAYPVFNVNRYKPDKPYDGDHGTAVLGVVLGVDNAKGIVGVAPGASLRRVVSRIRSDDDEWDLVNAVVAALDPGVMVAGDVLLIEVETLKDHPIRGYPVEIVDHWFDGIRLAVGNGIIVVEPAGNGYYPENSDDKIGRDLDKLENDWPDAPAWRSLNRDSSPLFLDSGAIVVSACTSAVAPDGAPSGTHRRMQWATFGSRIDCYAWGEGVYSAGYGWLPSPTPADPNLWYTDSFDGTSAASAIIAGAALLIQQMSHDTLGWRLSPAQVRALLSDKLTGVQVVDYTGTAYMGVMPDLAAIAARIGAIPDVFIRDSVDDAGAVPNDKVFQSPDIIVRNAAVADPATEFGAAGPWAHAVPPNDPIRAGQANYFYVRLRNRSLVSADGVAVTLYWSEASPLVAPVHWHLIGKLGGIQVTTGGALAVAGPLVWTPQAGDLPGHGCLVAVADHPLDPEPPQVPAQATWDDFLGYVGRNNNVAWRNFTVIKPLAAGAGLAASAGFVLRGAGTHQEFTLELIQHLPDGARLLWDVPAELAAMIRRVMGDEVVDEGDAESGRRLRLPTQRLMRFPRLRFHRDAAYRCLMRVDFPRRPRQAGEIVLRQLFERREVGRLTWAIEATPEE
jgi:hypothetical protein